MARTHWIHYQTHTDEVVEVVTDAGTTPLVWAGGGWWSGVVPGDDPYRYRVVGEAGPTTEAGARRPVPDAAVVVDRWRAPDPAARSRSSNLFARAVAAHHPPGTPPDGALRFRLLEPWVPPGHTPAVVGSDPALGAWDPTRALPLVADPFPWWSAGTDLEMPAVDLAYKYVLVDPDGEVTWEPGPDRRLPPVDGGVVVDDELRGLEPWRGAGVAVPVFSLRSGSSLGVGQFTDLVPFVDWAAGVGLSVVQILPVNDTVKTHDWDDSYPYDPISVKALHPLYLDIAEVVARHPAAEATVGPAVVEAREHLDGLDEVAYPEVMAEKWELAIRAFDACISADAEAVSAFVADEWAWLGPYAAWCVLRDRHGTPDMREWGLDARFDPARVEALADASSIAHREMAFHCWLQYHLYRQLDAAVAHARSRGVAIKGDLPIGVSPTSVETWVRPDLFRMGAQTGAPPDPFAERGQNWLFPTYVWEAMEADDYRWWRTRFEAMARSVDVYRIDHVLGFFRIWEVPEGEMDGLLGRFRPCLPIDGDALAADLGVDPGYLRRPFVDKTVLTERFGDLADTVALACFEGPDDDLRFGPRCADQQSLAAAFEEGRLAGLDPMLLGARAAEVRRALLDLRAEVLLLPVEGGDHPRILWGETEAYRRLPLDAQARFDEFATDFFFHRHEGFWGEHGRRTLAALLDATGLLACGEDLGMVPAVVPEVMADLGVLGLEIERMPKRLGAWIADPAEAPYASVVSTSTHDMAPIRQWWEDEPAIAIARYFHEALDHDGPVPSTLGGELAAEIVGRQLSSPAMLAIVPIQDLVAMDESLRRPDPRERINEPADRYHRWRFRLHLTTEALVEATAFNDGLRRMVSESGRSPS
ncbi:MAG: 4-alpha-glucanotransferase [Acidimicrobiia bacterium]